MTKRAKLNVDQALVIKELHKAGWTQESLARRYGVRQQQGCRRDKIEDGESGAE